VKLEESRTKRIQCPDEPDGREFPDYDWIGHSVRFVARNYKLPDDISFGLFLTISFFDVLEIEGKGRQ
jgi:hypothetical protein